MIHYRAPDSPWVALCGMNTRLDDIISTQTMAAVTCEICAYRLEADE